MHRVAILSALAFTACLPAPRLVEVFEETLPAADLTGIEVVVGAGDLEVVGVEGLDEVLVTARVYALFSDCDSDEEILRDMVFELYASDEGTARLWVDIDPERFDYTADVDVQVPAGFTADVRDGLGDLAVQDVAALTLDDEGGDILIERVAGDVEVLDGSGDLRIYGVGGALTLTDDSGDAEVGDVALQVQVRDGSGDLWIEDVGAAVRVDDDSGDLALRYVDGDADIVDGSGDIDVEHVTGAVRIRDGSGDISASDVGDLEIVEDGDGDVHWD